MAKLIDLDTAEFDPVSAIPAPKKTFDLSTAKFDADESGYIGGTAKALARGVAEVGVSAGNWAESNEDYLASGISPETRDESKLSWINKAGRAVSDISGTLKEAIPAPYANDNEAKRWLFEGTESLAPSLAYVAPSTVGAIAGRAVGTAAGAAAGLVAGPGAVAASPALAGAIGTAGQVGGAVAGQALASRAMYGSVLQQTMEELDSMQAKGMLRDDITQEQKMEIAKEAGNAEWQGEAPSSIVEAMIFSRLPGGNKISAMLKPGFKQFGKNLGMTAPLEVGGEVWTQKRQTDAMNSALKEEYQTDATQTMKDVVGPTLVMTTLMNAFGIAGQRITTHPYVKALENQNATPEERIKATNEVAKIIAGQSGNAETNRQAAINFTQHAKDAILDEAETGTRPYALDLADPKLLQPRQVSASASLGTNPTADIDMTGEAEPLPTQQPSAIPSYGGPVGGVAPNIPRPRRDNGQLGDVVQGGFDPVASGLNSGQMGDAIPSPLVTNPNDVVDMTGEAEIVPAIPSPAQNDANVDATAAATGIPPRNTPLQPNYRVDPSVPYPGSGRISTPDRPAATAYDEAELVTSEIDAAANEASTSPLNDRREPTQKEQVAGNYKKGAVKLIGLDIAIENPAGSIRKDKETGGQKWQTTMQDHYGYIRRSRGVNENGKPSQVDVFIGKNPSPAQVFVIDQIDPKTGRFDEHKAMIGYNSKAEAAQSYNANYEEGWSGMGAITAMSPEQFKSWVKSQHANKPLAYRPLLNLGGQETAIPAKGTANDLSGMQQTGSKEQSAVPALRSEAGQGEVITPDQEETSGQEEDNRVPEMPGTTSTGTVPAEVGPAAVEVKQPWAMTPKEYVADAKGTDEIAIRRAAHPQHVKDAIVRGESIPLPVLEAYKLNKWALDAIAKVTRQNQEDGSIVIYNAEEIMRFADEHPDWTHGSTNTGASRFYPPEQKKTDAETADILSSNNKPFHTLNSAKSARTGRGLRDSHDIVEVEGGFALRDNGSAATVERVSDTELPSMDDFDAMFAETTGEKTTPVEKSQSPDVPTFENAKPGEIYQTKVKRDGQIVTMYAVPSGGVRGAGDELHLLYSVAVAEQRAKAVRDERNAASRAKSEAIQATEKEKESVEKASRDDIDGFAADKLPMQRGNIIKTLNMQRNYDGRVLTLKAKIRELVTAGEDLSTREVNKIADMTRTQFNRANQQEQDAHEKKQREAGKKTVYYVGGYDVGKVGYEYAQHLTANKTSPVASADEVALEKVLGQIAELLYPDSRSFPGFISRAKEMVALAVKQGKQPNYTVRRILPQGRRMFEVWSLDGKNLAEDATISGAIQKSNTKTRLAITGDFTEVPTDWKPSFPLSKSEPITAPSQKTAPPQAPTKAPVDHAAEAKKQAAIAMKEASAAIKGILKNATDPNRLGSGPVVDDKVYQQIRPHLQAAWVAAKAAYGETRAAVQDYIKSIVEAIGAEVQPYARKFYGEILDGTAESGKVESENIDQGEEQENDEAGNGPEGTETLDSLAPGENAGTKGGRKIRGGGLSRRDLATTNAAMQADNARLKARKAELEAKFDPLLKTWQDAPPLDVVASESDLPDSVQSAIVRSQAQGQVRGVYFKGKVYLVAANLASNRAAEEVVFHEALGHHGVRKLFGPDFQREMFNLYLGLGGLSGIKKVAAQYNIDLSAYLDNAGKLSPQQFAQLSVDELLAHLAELNVKPNLYQKIMVAIRAVLKKLGLMELHATSDAELLQIVAQARDAVVKGKDGTVYAGGPRFAAAWHGSPHKFDKFSTEKIGTGEGAQAYGYGLYFAGSKDVAEYYKRALEVPQSRRIILEKGKPIQSNLRSWAARFLDDFKGDKAAAKQYADDAMTFDKKELASLSDHIDSIDYADIEIQGKGRLYQVELAPAEDEYLLWDKPLSEQGEKVKSIIEEAYKSSQQEQVDYSKRFPEADLSDYEYKMWADKVAMLSIMYDAIKGETYRTGSDMYHAVSRTEGGDDQVASEVLHSLGIRGIKYLDGTSRSKGDGNYNYVIFSEDDVAITAQFSAKKATGLGRALKEMVDDLKGSPYNKDVQPIELSKIGGPNEKGNDGRTLAGLQQAAQRRHAQRQLFEAVSYGNTASELGAEAVKLQAKIAAGQVSEDAAIQAFAIYMNSNALTSPDGMLTLKDIRADLKRLGHALPNSGKEAMAGIFKGVAAEWQSFTSPTGPQVEESISSTDINFSLGTSINDRLNTARTAQELTDALSQHPQVQSLVGSLFPTSGRQVSLWQRTIGTMYHLAESLDAKGMPEFKRVFNKGQDFLSDISTFAIRAESLAPGIFPKMGSGAGLFANLKSEDKKAISAPLIDGTLAGGGSPMQGRVWTTEELKSRYHLNDQQIALYRQARAAADQSLDDMARSFIAKYAKEADISFDREMSVDDMAEAVRDQMQELIDNAQDGLDNALDENMAKTQQAFIDLMTARSEKIKEIADKTRSLKAHGYFPLSRFGEYKVTMKNSQGETEFFSLYESARSASTAASQLRQENPDMVVTQGVMSKESFKLYGGLNLEAVELFAEHLSAEETAPYQEYLKVATNNRSVLRRLIQRKGTAGFSEDVVRVLANFIVSNARHSATQYNLNDMRKLAAAIPESDQGDVKDQAVKLYEYLSKPSEEASKLRGYLFFHYLGGSLASGITNMTQPVMMTAPYLASKTSTANAVSKLLSAAARAFTSPDAIGGKLGAALKRAEEDGITAPQEIHQLTAMASNTLFASNTYVNAGMKVWGSLFSTAEVFNRKTTFIAAYEIAVENKSTAPYADAVRAVNETQGIYNKGNRPNAARGTVGATLFTFKQFSVMYLELFKRLPTKQRLLMLGVLILAAGLEGLPFADDGEDLIDTLMQWAGYSWNTKAELKKGTTALLGETGSDIALRGLSAVAPLDIHGRLGMANLLPGTGILKQSQIDKTSDIKEFFGPAGGLLSSLSNALSLTATGMPGRAALAAAPRAIQGFAQGAEMATTGFGHDKYGRKTTEVSMSESLIKLTGFNPQRLAKESEIKGELMQDKNLMNVRKTEIVNMMVNGILDKDKEEQVAALAKLRDWNAKNPELRIRLDMNSVLRKVRAAKATSRERFIKSLPKDQRQRMIDALD